MQNGETYPPPPFNLAKAKARQDLLAIVINDLRVRAVRRLMRVVDDESVDVALRIRAAAMLLQATNPKPAPRARAGDPSPESLATDTGPTADELREILEQLARETDAELEGLGGQSIEHAEDHPDDRADDHPEDTYAE